MYEEQRVKTFFKDKLIAKVFLFEIKEGPFKNDVTGEEGGRQIGD